MPRKTYTIEARYDGDTKQQDAQFKEGVRIAAAAIQRHFPACKVAMFSDDFFEGHQDIAINAIGGKPTTIALGDALDKLPFGAAYLVATVLISSNHEIVQEPGMQRWVSKNCHLIVKALTRGPRGDELVRRLNEFARDL